LNHFPGSGGAKFFKTVESAGELAVTAHFILAHARFGFAKSESVTGWRILYMSLLAGLVGEAGRFHPPGSHETPVSDRHLVSEHALDDAGRFELFLQGGQESVETLALFAAQNHGAGEQCAIGVALGRSAFSYGRDRASRLRPIGA
jgi:hypothetical protein